MSILKAMNIGLSGLNANSDAITTIGENISNMNTTGYKENRANFRSVFKSTSVGIGDGVSIGKTQQDFAQGSLTRTGRTTDLAIDSNGFFIVNGQVGGTKGDFYTRAGQFKVDQKGFLTTQNGLRVQGYSTDKDNNIDRTKGLTDLQVQNKKLNAKKTSEINVDVNLDSTSENQPGGASFDLSNPGETSNFSSTITIHDSLGNPTEATIYYRKSDDSSTAGQTEWDYHVVANQSETDGSVDSNPTGGNLEEIGGGQLTFDSAGKLTAHKSTDSSGNLTQRALSPEDGEPGSIIFDPVGSPEGDTSDASNQTIDINFQGSTQYNEQSIIRDIEQDGLKAGELQNISVKDDGRIIGTFSNDEDKVIGQVALATFDSNQGLQRVGQNMWRKTLSSGTPAVGVPGTPGRGNITSGALESSNVDLAHQFTKLTATQRAYQANSRSITTSNQVLQETINLKR